jgi:predicted ester cyclase
MSLETNKHAVRRFFEEVLDGGNSTLLHELFTPEAARHFPGRTMRLSDTPAGAPRSYSAFKTDIYHLFGEGDLVTARITHHVTFVADARFVTQMGAVEAGGRSVSWDATVVFRFEDDRIAEEWVNRDELGILRQLGAVGAPAGV